MPAKYTSQLRITQNETCFQGSDELCQNDATAQQAAQESSSCIQMQLICNKAKKQCRICWGVKAI